MGKMKKYVSYEPAVGSTFTATVKGEKKTLIAQELGKNIKNPCNRCVFNMKTCALDFQDCYLCGNNELERSDGQKVQFLEVVTEE